MHFNREPSTVTQRAQAVRLLILDVDGVMTNGNLYYSDHGAEIKAFNTLDGLGIKLLQDCGIRVAIISGRSSTLLQRRAENLGVDLLYQGREDKITALEELCVEHGYQYTQIAYAGDDLPDLKVMLAVNLSFTVPNAHQSVRQIAHAQTDNAGGSGAVREIADFLLQAQNKYEAAIARFL